MLLMQRMCDDTDADGDIECMLMTGRHSANRKYSEQVVDKVALPRLETQHHASEQRPLHTHFLGVAHELMLLVAELGGVFFKVGYSRRQTVALQNKTSISTRT